MGSALLRGAALSSIAFASTAMAQESAEGNGATAPTEIIVTANKRAERLQDVPSSIAVVNTATLQNQGVTRLEDLQRAVPGLTLTSSTGGSHSTIAVRGIFSNNVSAGIPSAVGVVIDDLPQPVDSRAFNELVDIQRIEVLRGPQSTISGRNAAAGLINIVTRGPTDKLTIDASQTITTDEEYRTSLFVAGPLTDNLGGSLSGYYNDWEGNVRNLATGKEQGKESYGFRGRLEFKPSSALSLLATGYYQRLNEKQGTPLYQKFGDGAAFLGFLPVDTAIGPNITFDRSNQTVNSPTPVYQHSDSFGGSLRASLDIGRNQLVSITGYQREKGDTVQDVLGLNADTLTNFLGGWDGTQVNTLNLTTKSQELRFLSPSSDRFSYVLGLFYSSTDQDSTFGREVIAPYHVVSNLQYKNYAAYARATYKASDAITVLSGLRYNHDYVRYEADIDDNGTTGISSNHTSDDALLGDVSLQYRPLQDIMLYGRYARGLQGTGFDLNAPVTPGTPIPATEPGDVDSFELGAKTQFFENKLTFNLSVFHTVMRDYLSQKAVVTPSQLIFQLVDVGTVRARGFEVETSFRASDAFDAYLSASYTDSIYRNYVGAPCYTGQTAAQGCVNNAQDLSGKQLAFSPRWQLAGGAEYKFELPSAPFDVSFRADASYRSLAYFDSPGSANRQNGYAIVNLSASLLDHNDHFRITAFVNNLTDKEHVANLVDASSFFGGATALQTRSLPRDFRRYGGIRLSYTY